MTAIEFCEFIAVDRLMKDFDFATALLNAHIVDLEVLRQRAQRLPVVQMKVQRIESCLDSSAIRQNSAGS